MTELAHDTLDVLNAPKRLGSLHELSLMDTPPEEVFDRAVRLATRILGTEVGLLSLVDGKRQFFKAQTGLPSPYSETRETPLSHSFCQHVVSTGATLRVKDAREDERVRDNLAIRDLDVIAYLGVPVRDQGGEVLGSFCAIQSTPRDWTDEEREVLDDIAATIENELKLRKLLKQREADARAHEAVRQRLSLALKSGSMGTYDLNLKTGVAVWDDELFEIWGIDKGVENPINLANERMHPDDIPAHEAEFAACHDPEGDGLYAVEMRVRQKNGEYRWVASTGLVTFENGEPARMVGTVRDISERKLAEEHAMLLTAELNHRVKNLFAITNGIIAITSREAQTPAEMASALRSRIVSLSAAHDLVRPAITRDKSGAAETDLHTLTKTILGPHVRKEEQISVSGDAVPLTPQRASSLALVMHELATNASKYGAFTATEGAVDVAWTLADGNLQISWNEKNGPTVAQPANGSGFGSTLIDLTVKRQMKGDYELNWLETGLNCSMRLPWA